MSFTSFVISCFIIYFLPVIVPKHHWMRPYACYISYVVWALTTAFVVLPIHLILPSKGYILAHIAAQYYSKVIGVDWEIRNGNILEKYKNSIVIFNHQSMFDLLAIVIFCKPITNFIGVLKKEVMYVIPIGPLLLIWGSLFIDKSKNRHLALSKMKEFFSSEKDKSMIIFPEGTRNEIGEPLLPFKKGAFRIAVEFKRPIIPVVISPFYFIKPRKFHSDDKVLATVMEPIITTDRKEEDIDDLAKTTKELMDQEFKKMKKEANLHM